MKDDTCVSELKDEDAPETDRERALAEWKRSHEEFPTEQDCVDYIGKHLKGESYLVCDGCGSKQSGERELQRGFRCCYCKKFSWITAGSFFHGIKQVRVWLYALQLFEKGIFISAMALREITGVAYSTAASIVKKLQVVIETNMSADSLTVPSGDFYQVINKRSRETPARRHPYAEQTELELQSLAPAEDHGRQDGGASSPPAGTQLEGNEKLVFQFLSDEFICFDELCELTGLCAGEISAALIMLEMAEIITRGAGDRYALNKQPSRPASEAQAASEGGRYELAEKENGLFKQAVKFIESTYQGISRKYLQWYLAAFWCASDRLRWGQTDSLLRACCQSDHISPSDIRDYVSPLLVKLAPT